METNLSCTHCAGISFPNLQNDQPDGDCGHLVGNKMTFDICKFDRIDMLKDTYFVRPIYLNRPGVSMYFECICV